MKGYKKNNGKRKPERGPTMRRGPRYTLIKTIKRRCSGRIGISRRTPGRSQGPVQSMVLMGKAARSAHLKEVIGSNQSIVGILTKKSKSIIRKCRWPSVIKIDQRIFYFHLWILPMNKQ